MKQAIIAINRVALINILFQDLMKLEYLEFGVIDSIFLLVASHLSQQTKLASDRHDDDAISTRK